MSEPISTPENDAPTTPPEASARDDYCKMYWEIWEIDFTKDDVDATVMFSLEILRFFIYRMQFIVWTITIPISMICMTALGLYMGNHSSAARLKLVAIVGSCTAVMCAAFGASLWFSFRQHINSEALSMRWTPNLKRLYAYFCGELRPAFYFCVALVLVNIYGVFLFWHEMGAKSIYAPIVDCANIYN